MAPVYGLPCKILTSSPIREKRDLDYEARPVTPFTSDNLWPKGVVPFAFRFFPSSHVSPGVFWSPPSSRRRAMIHHKEVWARA